MAESKSSFALAQDRLNARRRARDATAQASAQASTVSIVEGLPFPLRSIGHAGISTFDRIKGREGTRPAFRVGQVDAELLDEELVDMLRGQVGEGLKYFGTHLKDDWNAEIDLILRGILFKLSIWDHNATYGAALQNLRFTDARSSSATRPAPTRWQKSIYGLVTVGGSYAWRKANDFLARNEYSTSSGDSPQLARLSQVASMLSTTHSFLALISFCAFLTNGRYRTLLDRILRLRLAPPSNQASRAVSFEYLNRQLVWHAFTEFLLFALPLIGISRWKRWIRRIWRTVQGSFGTLSSEQTKDMGEFHYLPERTCAICYQDQQTPLDSSAGGGGAVVGGDGGGIIGSSSTDITNPYSAIPCECIYCYVCLVQRLEAEEGQGIVCLRCGALVRQCQPWDGDVVMPERDVTDEDNDDGEDGEKQSLQGHRRVSFADLDLDPDLDLKFGKDRVNVGGDDEGSEATINVEREGDGEGEGEGEGEGDTTAVDEDEDEDDNGVSASQDIWSKIHRPEHNGFLYAETPQAVDI